MSGIRLYSSNRLEILAEALADRLSAPLPSPFEQEVIVVQSRGMERWVSLQLARHHGICANYRFPFPNAFVYEIFRKAFTNLPERSLFEPSIMTWKIVDLLPEMVLQPGFEVVRNYLDNDTSGLKCFQLAERIVDLFDQYLLFRPEMMLRWQEGQDDHWQAILWRSVAAGCETQHRAALAQQFLIKVSNCPSDVVGLPERVAIFGISALPRFHLQVISGIAKVIEVNLFLMNPCQQYWGDIASEREIARTVSNQLTLPEDVYLERGNSLLSSMGQLGRDFWDSINEFQIMENELFQEPAGNHLLSSIQSDILNLRDRIEQQEMQFISPHDTSIQIHSCHSPMREMEVLYDRLLDMFKDDPDLAPRDILVMVPDIEVYAPYIEAVFDTPPNENERIPYSIADRSMRKESHVIDTFLAVLELCRGRFTASDVLDILQSEVVQRRFDLVETDLELIRKWVRDTRIRWGLDADDRSRKDLPAFAENTWKSGIERLLLGYAMPTKSQQVFQGIVPYDNIEGTDALVLGRFVEFLDKLFSLVASLDQPRTLMDWAAVLMELLEALFQPDEPAQNELQAIRLTLKELSEVAELADFNESIDLKVLKKSLQRRLEKETFGFGFITGGVTFCAMLPMRSIPSKVICLLGMDNDAYPRQTKALGFDLMAKHPQKGDRSRRNDDRYLFLEAVLSARQKLYISYVGQSIRDNSVMPPSVLVSELMDYIESGFAIPNESILTGIVTEHRLQAFSLEYFKDDNEKLFSYSEENCTVAKQILTPDQSPAQFISEGLSAPEEQWKDVGLQNLCRFFGNPTRFLLNQRLGLYLEGESPVIPESESFAMEGLEKYSLSQELVQLKLEGHDLKNLFPVQKAMGLLPHGTPGMCTYDDLSHAVKGFVDKTGVYLQNKIREPINIELVAAGLRLSGNIESIYGDRLVHYRYSKLKATDHLRVWIQHLVLCLLSPHDFEPSLVIGLSPAGKQPQWVAFEYAPVTEAQEFLEVLLDFYWQGLVRPIHFFPKSAWEYAEVLLREGKSEEDAIKNAAREWEGNDFYHGESKDPYYELCFRYTNPIDDEFQLIARQVFMPLFEHRSEVKG